MKIILEESIITLEAENFADKLYIAKFIKKAAKNKLDKNLVAEFSYSKSRMYENHPQGGGSTNPARIVETLFEAEEGQERHLVAVEEIESLRLFNYLP